MNIPRHSRHCPARIKLADICISFCWTYIALEKRRPLRGCHRRVQVGFRTYTGSLDWNHVHATLQKSKTLENSSPEH
jgi:hypothetical protein